MVSDAVKLPSKRSQFSRVFIVGIAWLLLGISALSVLGTFLPATPYLGMAALIMPALPFWFWVVPLISGTLIVWMAKKRTVKRAAATVALLTIGGTFFISLRMAQAFKAQGADVSMFSSAELSADSVQADATVQFGSFDGQPLYADVYKPSGSAALAPILVNIHGGAWVSNTRKETAADQRWFAQQGWLVFSIDYTLSTEKKHYWNSVHGQIGCFLAWLTAHANQYGGDTTKITLTGGSAGGNLALNVASMAGQNALTSTCGGTLSPVAAVAVLVPGVDPADIVNNEYPLIGPWLQSIVPNYPGGSPQRYPDRYKAIKSSTYLSPSTPPTLIFTALSDHLVDYRSIDAYAAQAQKMGVQLTYLRIPFADHSTMGIPGSIANKGYRQVTLDWLMKLGLGPTDASRVSQSLN